MLHCRNPNLAAKQKKTKEQQLKERPRFSSVAKVPIALGGFKPQLWTATLFLTGIYNHQLRTHSRLFDSTGCFAIMVKYSVLKRNVYLHMFNFILLWFILTSAILIMQLCSLHFLWTYGKNPFRARWVRAWALTLWKSSLTVLKSKLWDSIYSFGLGNKVLVSKNPSVKVPLSQSRDTTLIVRWRNLNIAFALGFLRHRDTPLLFDACCKCVQIQCLNGLIAR